MICNNSNRAQALIKLESFGLAIIDANEAIKLDPNHANSLYNYGVMLDSTRKDYDNAEKYYREAIRANPKHAYALYNLAVLLEEIRKDNDGAEEFFQRSVSVNLYIL